MGTPTARRGSGKLGRLPLQPALLTLGQEGFDEEAPGVREVGHEEVHPHLVACDGHELPAEVHLPFEGNGRVEKLKRLMLAEHSARLRPTRCLNNPARNTRNHRCRTMNQLMARVHAYLSARNAQRSASPLLRRVDFRRTS